MVVNNFDELADNLIKKVTRECNEFTIRVDSIIHEFGKDADIVIDEDNRLIILNDDNVSGTILAHHVSNNLVNAGDLTGTGIARLGMDDFITKTINDEISKSIKENKDIIIDLVFFAVSRRKRKYIIKLIEVFNAFVSLKFSVQ